MEKYLKSTYYFDFDHPEVKRLIDEFSGRTIDSTLISDVFIRVRDGWKYNAYNISIKPGAYRASEIAHKEEAHCVDKAIIFIAILRGLGIPSRIRLAKVSNHIAVERLVAKLGTNELAPHGIVDVYFNGKWTKVSNAFNKELCDRFQVAPLEYDGSEDAIFQAYNLDNQQFMEYLEDYGHFEDVPFDFIVKTFTENYPEYSRQLAQND